MHSIIPGHLYELENFEPDGPPAQRIQFIEKRPVFSWQPGQDPVPTGELATVANGTTNEEVLKVLIDRLKVLGDKLPCRENSIAVTHVETALLWLEKRTAERKARGVEGKHLK